MLTASLDGYGEMPYQILKTKLRLKINLTN